MGLILGPGMFGFLSEALEILGVLLDEHPGMLSVLLEAIIIFWGFHQSL